MKTSFIALSSYLASTNAPVDALQVRINANVSRVKKEAVPCSDYAQVSRHLGERFLSELTLHVDVQAKTVPRNEGATAIQRLLNGEDGFQEHQKSK